MDFRTVTLTRSYQQVVEQIQDGIRRGSLRPGQRLPTERELGESFGVSRAVVREALKVLSASGLVESRQGSGNYISANPVPSISRALVLSATPAEESIVALFEVRESLELTAARLAAVRRSDEQAIAITAAAARSIAAAEQNDLIGFGHADHAVHQGICAATGNRYLESVVQAVRELLSQALELAVGIAGRMAEAAAQHAAIARAIAVKDADAAAAHMAEHIEYTAGWLHDLIATGTVIDIAPMTRGRDRA